MHHQTIKEPICLTGCHCEGEDQGDLTMCPLPEIKFYSGQGCFSLPHIDETLQAVHNCQWFMSFDLAQGYLQMPVEEADTQKLHLGLDHLAYMGLLICHLGYPTLGPVFCHLMEMCLGDQQSVTLLLYLDNICVFAASRDEMLDHI